MLATQGLHLLLFSERGFSFGVYAEQVKELLKDEARSGDRDAESAHTFAYKGRALQVLRLTQRLQLQEAFEGPLGFLSPQEPETENEAGVVDAGVAAALEPSSRILVVQHAEEGDVGVHVDCLQQLRLVPLTHISRLPLLMERKKRFQSVWGLALIDTRAVVLIDLEHI